MAHGAALDGERDGEGGLKLTRGGPLDLLRFLAAFFMVVYHFADEAPTKLGDIHPVFTRGYLATDFFLIVSGYVLARIYGARVAAGGMSPLKFFLRRAGRVVPAHLIMIGAFIALFLGCAAIGVRPQHPEWFDWRELPAQVLLIQAWGVPGGQGWNSPSWSLSALLACYAAFPLVWPRLLKWTSVAGTLALAAGAFVLADIFTRTVTGYPIVQMPLGYGVLRALPLFFIGVALGRFSEATVIARPLATGLGLAAAAALCVAQAFGRFDYLSIGLISTIVVCGGAIAPRRRSALLEKLALIAFALFITNELVRNAWFGVVHIAARKLTLGEGAQWALWSTSLLAAVLFAVAFHYLIDMPTQGLLKRATRGAKPRTASPASLGAPATA